jgi:hypothetical protein
MQLSGLDKPSAKPKGGVVTVELIAADEFIGAFYDAELDCFTYMEASAAMACYVFREDGCTYNEQSVGIRGRLVKHTLSMEFAATEETRQALAELTSAAESGLVAIVTTGSGERLLVGYSPRFAGRFPLRIESNTYTRGTTPADFPTQTIVLVSEDVEPSRRLGAV